ncbi:MAG TPA: hypothetical protein VFO10_07910 [Oligoflexus sp.]|uniref:hypothetical protein n=1 Tax=Oligoflexus sp. TaxID=1971216 RepID=UPI002D802BC1|nr:hypothetical protein [Oligoflexus sp.]HET9237160.1 hypothetical protein [Oligoflexus sp.]
MPGNLIIILLFLTFIDMISLEKKQIIPLPEDLRYTQHPGLEFSISSDKQYYYVSFAEYVFRIDWNTNKTAIYKDPKGCWIRRPELAPTGELFYVNYSEPAKPKDCNDVYRIDWSQQEALASRVSNDGRKQYLDFKDLSGGTPDQTFYSKSSGYLKTQPMYRNVLYLEGERSLHLISLPLQKNTFLDTQEIPLPLSFQRHWALWSRCPAGVLCHSPR